MAIIDCFPVFNEMDVLELRLRHMDTLTPRPDRFVIVEMTRTFSGQPKELHFQMHSERFRAWHDVTNTAIKIAIRIIRNLPVQQGSVHHFICCVITKLRRARVCQV